ncbi:MAG TPA: hypothetical protein VGE41_05205 [Verrucomicrobiae bacterium]
MNNKGLSIALIGLAGLAISAQAENPVQLSLWPPSAQLVPDTESVRGVRLSINGRNVDMTGLDIGIANQTTGDFSGFGLSFINLVDGNMKGVQWGYYGYTRVAGDAYGWTSGLVSHVKGDNQGLQDGIVSMTYGRFQGLQASVAWNHTGDEMHGVQLGFVNTALSVRGMQLGIVNYTERMYGIQIGLWNQINENEKLKVLPFFNWRF